MCLFGLYGCLLEGNKKRKEWKLRGEKIFNGLVMMKVWQLDSMLVDQTFITLKDFTPSFQIPRSTYRSTRSSIANK